jgi:hypothetical protein
MEEDLRQKRGTPAIAPITQHFCTSACLLQWVPEANRLKDIEHGPSAMRAGRPGRLRTPTASGTMSGSAKD